MGKDSSPLMKGAKTIGVSFAKPKLKASKMSFVRAKKAQAIKAEDLKRTRNSIYRIVSGNTFRNQ